MTNELVLKRKFYLNYKKKLKKIKNLLNNKTFLLKLI